MPSKMKYKRETARTYLNTSYLTKSTRKTPKLRNYTTTPIIKKTLFVKKELCARLHSKDNEIKKLKEKLADLNDRYKQLQKENCCLKLKSIVITSFKK